MGSSAAERTLAGDQAGNGEDATLVVKDLSISFTTDRGSICAVDKVSFAVGPGRVLAVVGESGCGKSATAMSLLGLESDNASVSGSVQLQGRELIGLSEAQLSDVRGREMTVVFQEPMTSLNPVLRVGQQVAEVLRRHSDLTRRECDARVVELFARVGIPEPARRVREYPHQLSGGMRQRVMIAIAIACSPKIIIADEPTTALDVTVQATILQIVRDLAESTGTAVLLITHDMGVVADVADDVAVMYAGRIVEQGPVTEIFANPSHPYTRALLAATPIPGSPRGTRLAEIPGLVPAMSSPATSCAFCDRCSRSLVVCSTERPVLAEVRDEHLVSCFNPWTESSQS